MVDAKARKFVAAVGRRVMTTVEAGGVKPGIFPKESTEEQAVE